MYALTFFRRFFFSFTLRLTRGVIEREREQTALIRKIKKLLYAKADSVIHRVSNRSVYPIYTGKTESERVGINYGVRECG